MRIDKLRIFDLGRLEPAATTVHIFGLSSNQPPVTTYAASTLAEVDGVLVRAEMAAAAGRWAAVVVSYEAAPAFEPAMRVRAGNPSDLPLAWAAEFDTLEPEDSGRRVSSRPALLPVFQPALDAAMFVEQVRRVQHHIADGDTYQVNLTFPMQAEAPDDLDGWFQQLLGTQQAPYAACLDLGRHVVLSLSPELFFESDAATIRTRPMKGTLHRGRWQEEDEALARALATSPKAQAENVMIVDLLRNDIGRVAQTGSVHVPALFEIERYPTLWQMTSTVEGALTPGTRLTDIFRALFPCGSVTGAPKISTMEIIAGLEATPRGLYTGAIGLLAPDGRVTFSVAIRTVVVDRNTGTAMLGVGAGITADSVPHEEYTESLLKSAFTTTAARDASEPFDLLETMRLENGVVTRLERHLQRMHQSARYFGFPFPEDALRAEVTREAAARQAGIWRLRLLTGPDGAFRIECTPHTDAAPDALPWRVAFANAPVDESNPFLCNKTTKRTVYDVARRGRPDVDDVLLWNSRGELTESTIANVVVEIDGERCTPPIDCGLLPGTLRGELLDAGGILERVITRGEVMRAPRLWLINSMRGWIDAQVVR